MSTKNIHEPKEKSARTSFRKTAAKPLQLLGPWYKSALLHHLLQQEKALHSSWASPAKGQLLSGDGQQSLAGWDGMGGMRNVRGCGTEPGAPIWGTQLLES